MIPVPNIVIAILKFKNSPYEDIVHTSIIILNKKAEKNRVEYH